MSHAGRRWSLVAGALLALLGAVAVAVYPGIYNVAADVPHTQPVYWLFETARDRSIGARARNIVVPNDLSDPARISSGAGQYAEMCSVCHLAPLWRLQQWRQLRARHRETRLRRHRHRELLSSVTGSVTMAPFSSRAQPNLTGRSELWRQPVVKNIAARSSVLPLCNWIFCKTPSVPSNLTIFSEHTGIPCCGLYPGRLPSRLSRHQGIHRFIFLRLTQ